MRDHTRADSAGTTSFFDASSSSSGSNPGASGSSSSSSSSSHAPSHRTPTSSETIHPLLPPIGHPAITPFHNAPPPPPTVPEKCLTFCSQRADAPPLCRMLCLRRRQRVLSRTEELARLKGKGVQRDRPETSGGGRTRLSGSASGAVATEVEESGDGLLSMFKGWSFNPFAALHRAVEPYSIVYVRGTPDGVIGRYMEEMEVDDGNHDFGHSISRHAKPRGREERVMEYLDWGEDGALLHLPLASIFHPVTSIPSTVRTIFTPSYNMLSLYVSSFTDGSGAQVRGARSFLDAAYNLEGLTFLGKIRDHHQKMVKQRFEQEAERRKELKKVADEVHARRVAIEAEVKDKIKGFKAAHEAGDEGEEQRYLGEIERLRKGTGGSGLRRKIEEAMERDEEYRRNKAAGAAKGEDGKGGDP